MAAKPCKQADLRQNRLMCCVYLIERIQRCMFKEKPHLMANGRLLPL